MDEQAPPIGTIDRVLWDKGNMRRGYEVLLAAERAKLAKAREALETVKQEADANNASNFQAIANAAIKELDND